MSCLPESGLNDVDHEMLEHVVHAQPEGRAVNGSRLLLRGLACKKKTGDLCDSPAIDVAGRL